jgi:hypothetical protein
VGEVSRQIGSSISEASVCLQPLSHDDEAMLLAPVSKRVHFVGTPLASMLDREGVSSMVKFSFLPLDDSRLTPAHKAQFIIVGQFIKWELTDVSGSYSGLVIVGREACTPRYSNYGGYNHRYRERAYLQGEDQ